MQQPDYFSGMMKHLLAYAHNYSTGCHPFKYKDFKKDWKQSAEKIHYFIVTFYLQFIHFPLNFQQY